MSPLAQLDVKPSLKGATVAYAVKRLLVHRETGKLTDDLLDSHLEPDDREILENRVAPTLWYPLENYDRLVLLLREIEGGAGDEWWIQYGEESAGEILTYAPIQLMLKGARRFGPRAGSVLVKMSQLYFNFTRWQFEGDSLESFHVEVHEAEGMSEICRLIILGFLRYLARDFVGHDVEIVSSRPTEDLILYHTP